MTAFAFDREAMPLGISLLKTDARGYPVPWFVDRKADKADGQPDFRIMDHAHLKLAIREKRCWVCGLPIREPDMAFVAGPMCGINRTSAEPPCHVYCARWSAQACPFLSHPKRVRDDAGLPEDRHVAGIGIMRNPGVAMVWTCEGYETFRPHVGGDGVLFQLGEPLRVEWYAHGRAATYAEVVESVETGLPLLLRSAAQEGAAALFDLGRMTERFMALLPPQDATTDG